MSVKPLHERLTDAEAASLGRRFVREMRRCDLDQCSTQHLMHRLIEAFDDARQWAGEPVKQRRASIGGREGQGFRRAA